MWVRISICLFVLTFVINLCSSRIHKLEIKRDQRKYIPLSTFGFFKKGILDVKFLNFHTDPALEENDLYGFSIYRTINNVMTQLVDKHQEQCLLESPGFQNSADPRLHSRLLFTIDLKKKMLMVNCSSEVKSLLIVDDKSKLPPMRLKRDSLSDQSLLMTRRKRNLLHQSEQQETTLAPVQTTCADLQIPIQYDPVLKNCSANFVIYVPSEEEQGLYNLFFHSCPNYKSKRTYVDFTLEITEENNNGNYLSAGDMPLPVLYFMMSVFFFLSGCFWVFILVKSKHPVYKIHYLMAVLVYLKSLSLLFHCINYHFIKVKGEHVATWAILYYITHLLKGSVLFITIVLIGTGWTFIKHILSDKDKKIFMIVIPLQVLANVANIIIEESEEGDIEYNAWFDIVILVDLICCGAILFPVVWSIRHLQEASHTDGKAAINLRKLKLFRHFYVMIVCYIYFTRIIGFILKMTVSFQYEWLDAMFQEMVTYVFFVMTGYKFRPASANPYFQVSNDDDDEEDDDEMDVVVSQCGVKEGLSKLSRTIEASQEEKDLLINKRESSHEYD